MGNSRLNPYTWQIYEIADGTGMGKYPADTTLPGHRPGIYINKRQNLDLAKTTHVYTCAQLFLFLLDSS